LKVVLQEIRILNEARMNQEVIIRKRESIDIQKGEYQTKKLERNLEEVKKKLVRS
jgi:Na+-transporting NADH:ubiquinone oxidoreductase subunit NqrA